MNSINSPRLTLKGIFVNFKLLVTRLVCFSGVALKNTTPTLRMDVF